MIYHDQNRINRIRITLFCPPMIVEYIIIICVYPYPTDSPALNNISFSYIKDTGQQCYYSSYFIIIKHYS